MAVRFLCVLLPVLACVAAPVQARDGRPREQEPLADRPLPCPIEAPVRVASASTLAGFTALDGCRASDVIVAPATALPRNRAAVRSERIKVADDRAVAIDDAKPTTRRGGRRAPARATGSAPIEPGAVTVEVATLPQGTAVVRIAMVTPLPELTVAVAATEGAAAGGLVGADPIGTGVAEVMGLRPLSYTTSFDGLIADAAVRHGVDPLVLHAVIKQESGYRANAFSRVGARGLMQVMPGTGAMLGVRNADALWDPATNIDTGAKLVAQLWRRFNGRFDLVLAAYNAGEGAVTRYGYRIPPYRETQNYVVAVQQHYRRLAGENGLQVSGL